MEKAAGIFGAIRNDESRRAIWLDNVDTMHLDSIEVCGLIGAVNGSREIDARGYEEYNGDGCGVDYEKCGC
jgi:hypothetical protein